MPEFESVSCPFAHKTPAKKLFDRPDWWFQLPGDFAWYRCPECEVLFLNPRPTPTSIEAYYPSAYAAYRPAIDDERWALMRWKRRRNMRHQITAVTSQKKNGRLLDIGCATGNYLAEMQKLGWDVAGIELQTEAANYAQTRYSIDVFNGDLLAYPPTKNKFDVITLWDVLEHTHHPLQILTKAQALLKQEGLLIFSIPNPNGKEATSFGPAWIGYDSPRHLYLFHDKSLHLLLQKTGFTFEKQEHTLGTYHTWVASWQTKDNANDKLSKPVRRLRSKIAQLPFWSILTAPYFSKLNKREEGTVLTIFARVNK